VAVVPVIIIAEKRDKMKPAFCGAVALLTLSTLLMAGMVDNFAGIVVALFLFFLAFNLLEATLPSLISKIAPVGSKGTAIGVYNSFQFFGLFLGGAVGGFLAQHASHAAVFAFSSGLCVAWLLLALSMQKPPAVRTRMYHVGYALNQKKALALSKRLSALEGITEAVVIANEGVAYLKVSMGDWDETHARALIEKGESHGVG
jgi:MFS family permease